MSEHKLNEALNRARYSAGTDEWYTPYEVVEDELAHYTDAFAGKSVLCCCDDPVLSNFAYYFLRNFNNLGLKRLVCTSYVGSRVGSIDNCIPLHLPESFSTDTSHGTMLVVDSIDAKPGIVSDDTIDKLLASDGVLRHLEGDGDFRSIECRDLMLDCDICCTNPPFSLFVDLFLLLNEYGKQYLLIGNQNALLYKEIFPYVVANKAWVGYRFGDMRFRVPPDTEPRATRYWVDDTGQKWRSLGNAMWLTNIDIPRRHKPLELKSIYTVDDYPKYDGQDVISVRRVSEIPKDYYGVMGVPLTFMKYYDSSQFEIVGEANHGSDNEYDLFKPKIGGKEKFKSLLIRRVQREYSQEFKVLDLFCGAGGFSYGLDKNAHFKTVIALDFDEAAADTFKRNMPYADVFVGDITEDSVKRSIIERSRELGVNMIIGGPPCQGYSMKGKKLGLDDPRNYLFREYLSFVAELRPEVFLIENVRTILSTSKGWFKKEIIAAIESLGYSVEVGVLNSRDYGVPQSRERAIFVCSRISYLSLPKPTTTEIVSVRDAIGDLAYLNSGEGSFKQPYRLPATSEYQELMRRDSTALYNHKASNHKQVAIDKLMLIPPEQGREALPPSMLGRQQYSSTWGRLKWADVSPTIDTRFDACSNGTNNHPVLHRAITPREAARLQSFDDRFIFYGKKVYIRKQIGNAVPPLMAKAIADSLYEQIKAYSTEF